MIPITKLIFLFLFSIFSSLLLCQDSESEYIFDKITFSGNNNTKASYLHQNISCRTQMSYTLSDVEFDVQQLRNLPSIANASYVIDNVDNESVLQFVIEERKTKLPLLNIGGIKDNVWIGIGMIESNFRQRGNSLLAYYQFTDGRHSAEVFYKNPRTLKGIWGYTASLRKWSSIEPLFFPEGTVQYLYDNNSLGLSLIRNFGLRSYVELGATLFRESYSQAESQEILNPPGPKSLTINKYLSKFRANHNQLFYSYFYLKGYSLNLIYQNVYNFQDGTFFNIIELASKVFFRPRPKLNIATRLHLGVSTNNDSPFAPFVVDSRINIRGIGNRIDRGTAQAILNVEARRTIYHVDQWSSQVVLFSDLGSWRRPGGELKHLIDDNNFRHFVGGGIRIAYQKVFGATLRLDYSIDLYNLKERGFVFGLGQYF